jgi:hypothetical protein
VIECFYILKHFMNEYECSTQLNTIQRYLNMKKLLLTLALTLTATTSMAWGHHGHHGHHNNYHHHYHGGYGGGWIGPAIIGGVIGYELSRPTVVTQPVIVQQAPIVVQPGAIPPYGYHYVQIYDQNCGCYKQALMQD